MKLKRKNRALETRIKTARLYLSDNFVGDNNDIFNIGTPFDFTNDENFDDYDGETSIKW